MFTLDESSPDDEYLFGGLDAQMSPQQLKGPGMCSEGKADGVRERDASDRDEGCADE